MLDKQQDLKCGGKAVNEHSNQQNVEIFKAKFKKKKILSIYTDS